MVQIFKNTKIDFLGVRKIAIGFSIVLTLITIVSLIVHRGFNYSIDFVGGSLVQLKFEKPVKGDLHKIRSAVASLNYGTPEVKSIGAEGNNELQITIKKKSADLTKIGEELKGAIQKNYPENPFQVRRYETVGPKVGGELKWDAIISLTLALIAILIYIAFRFQISFGVACLIPLFHDVIVTAGVFSVFNIEFSLTLVAALLTIVGYSLNDNVIIFDRIRENMKAGTKNKTFYQIINDSINQTLSRTIITSGITFVVITLLYIFGSEAIKDFSLAMMIGVVIGTYSTIYIASPILLWWHTKWPSTKSAK
jgi:preprotein translocase subunit SecF